MKGNRFAIEDLQRPTYWTTFQSLT